MYAEIYDKAMNIMISFFNPWSTEVKIRLEFSVT